MSGVEGGVRRGGQCPLSGHCDKWVMRSGGGSGLSGPEWPDRSTDAMIDGSDRHPETGSAQKLAGCGGHDRTLLSSGRLYGDCHMTDGRRNWVESSAQIHIPMGMPVA